jgi:hypothetical protein
MKTVVKLLPVLALCWVPAHADTILYSDSGTFTASTPSDAFAFSGPSETWAFSFQADTQPAALDFGMGGFNFPFSDFSYSLDGSPVSITPTFIHFFSAPNGGGFEICFNGTTVGSCTDGFATPIFPASPQMYSGATSMPTLTPGEFTDAFDVVVSSNVYAQPNTTVLATATAVPEPSTLLTLATALLALGVRRLYWRR